MLASRLDLKLRLALRVAGLAVLCFVAAAGYIVFETNRAARARADWTADMVARDLELQQAQRSWVKAAPNLLPDLQRIGPALMAPGLCIEYRSVHGDTLQRMCSGTAPGDTAAPVLFANLYERIFADRESVRPIGFGGEAVASIDRATLVAESWRETSRLAAVMAVTLLGLCIFVYWAFADALRPTGVIRVALARLAAGDLSARLPPFDLAELSAVGDVFNHLAASLETTLAERNALTQRLIAVQDEERLHLARELHDEFGQCLAAIGAVAASAGQTARDECPGLVAECESVGRTAGRMMAALRGTLLRLRPPDVEELGLACSLESLVAGWNRDGSVRFTFALEGDVDALPGDFAACVYRIAQEAITNAVKHARASRVRLCVRMLHSARIELLVEDDGTAGPDVNVKSGMGLLGMRERVATLGGSLTIEARQPSGLIVRADIPVPVAPVGDKA